MIFPLKILLSKIQKSGHPVLRTLEQVQLSTKFGRKALSLVTAQYIPFVQIHRAVGNVNAKLVSRVMA